MKLFNATYYHGSGVSFDKFDFQFMGTGEGHQAHGWGIYLAQNKDTSAMYRRNMINGEGTDNTLAEQGFSDSIIRECANLVRSGTIDNILMVNDIQLYNDIYSQYNYVYEQMPENCNPRQTIAIIYTDGTVHYFECDYEEQHFWDASQPRPKVGMSIFNGIKTPETCLLFVEMNHFDEDHVHWEGSWENTNGSRYIEYLESNIVKDKGMLATVEVAEDCVFAREDLPVESQNDIVKNVCMEILNQNAATLQPVFDPEYIAPKLKQIASRILMGPGAVNKFVNTTWNELVKNPSATLEEVKDKVRIACSCHESYLSNVDKLYDCIKENSDPVNYYLKNTFKKFYDKFSFDDPRAMSMYLLEKGVDGISYDGRWDGECLVLFNLDKCQIVEKE